MRLSRKKILIISNEASLTYSKYLSKERYAHDTSVCMYIHIYIYMYIYTCVYVCMYVCMYVCVCVCVCVCARASPVTTFEPSDISS
jgi:hypothetical protein